MKLKLSERERWLLLAAVLLGVFCVFYVFILGPGMTEISSLSSKLNSLKVELKTSEEKAKILQSLELTPLEKLRAKKGKEEQVIEALNYIAKEVSRLNLNLLSIRPRLTEQAVDSAKVIFIDLTFLTRYNTIYKFMQALEKLPILILVDSMTMSRGVEGGDLSVSIVLSVYY